MCFIIDEKHPNRMIAKRDITCYKVLRRNFTSFVRGYAYELGKLYVGLLGIPIDNGFYKEINLGFHSYSNKSKVPFKWYEKKVFVKCIIPKGSMYYYNSDEHTYVSNQIIIKEVL